MHPFDAFINKRHSRKESAMSKSKKQPKHIKHLVAAKSFLKQALAALESNNATIRRQCDLIRYAERSMESALIEVSDAADDRNDVIDLEMALDRMTDQLDEIEQEWKHGEIGRNHVWERVEFAMDLVTAIIKK